MFARLFRLSNRVGRLTVKGGGWAGERITSWATAFGRWFTHRTNSSSVNTTTDSARVENQVRSLSGLIVILLAGFVLLVLWATNAQAGSNLVVKLLGPTSAPPNSIAPSPNPDISNPLQWTTGTIIFSMWAGAQEDLFALSPAQPSPVRLTDNTEDDRDPAWSPDGQRIAFASRRDGNWELYTLALATGEIKRLTYDLVYEANPSWSPDSQWLAYEGYHDGNLDIYIVRSDGSERPIPGTRNPAPDFDPAWGTSPEGREIAYVSLKDGNQDIYVLSLDDPRDEHATNITNTPLLAENSPAWGSGGAALAYSVTENGVSLIYSLSLSEPNASPRLVGQGHSPSWSPDGNSLVFLVDGPEGSLLLTGQPEAWDTSPQAFALPGIARGTHWSSAMLPQPLPGTLAFAALAPVTPAYSEMLLSIAEGSDAPYSLMLLPGVIAESEQQFLSDRVDSSFVALKDYMNRTAGWDFLGRLDQVWWGLKQLVEPGQQYRNWHKTGRAFDIIQDYNQGNPPQIEVIQEQIGPEVYWRIYVRCAVQDGTLGEPLRHAPWDFDARTSGDVVAYDAGGRTKGSVPAGYYVDFTEAAQLFGWYPSPSDGTWRYNWPGVLYWQYEKREDLDWWTAMLELYPEASIKEIFDTPTFAPTGPMTLIPLGTETVQQVTTSTSSPSPRTATSTKTVASTQTPTVGPTDSP
jgi:TolB protein